MAQIYRKAALDRLSSPEQLDKSITIISPSFWVALVGGGLIAAVALIWSIVGRLPVNVTVSGIYMGTAGVGGVASEGTGLVDEVYIKEGDYVKEGQNLIHLDFSTAEDELESLRERREKVAQVEFDSENDTLTADNKALADIKSQRILADNGLNTNKSVLESKKKELAEAEKKTETARAAYQEARDAYLDSMTVQNQTAEQLYLQDAQTLLSEARTRLLTAETTYKQMANSENQQARQLRLYEETAADAEAKLDDAEAAARAAQDSMIEQQGYLQAAQTALDEASAVLQQAQAAYQAVQTEAEARAAEENLQSANEAMTDAQAAYSDAREAYSHYESAYQSASALVASTSQTYNSSLTNLRTAREQYESARDAADAAYSDVEYYTDLIDQRQEAYDKAEQDYIDAMGSQTALLSDNSKAGTAYNSAYQEYNTLLSQQRSLETTIIQLSAQVDADQGNLDDQNKSLRMQFDSAKASALHQLDQEIAIREKSAKTQVIKANRDGYVSSLNVAKGNAVQAGTVVCRISTDQENVQAVVCYVPVSEGRKIKKDMQVVVYPSTVNRQEYGHMEGTVDEVSEFLSSQEEMLNLLGDPSLVQAFQQPGPVVKVLCSLKTDENTVSGYKWSSRKGASIALDDGTIVSADVVTEEKAPISMLIPYIKEKLTIG